MSLKPITIHSHAAGPNPWKVVLLLEELDIPYEQKLLDFPYLKTPEFEKLNPNGRVPAIEDPNTGITLFESGAILEYIIETYDKSKRYTYESSPEKFYVKQWLHFQVSGQGPYFGQRVWFNLYHQPKVPSAVERYGNEIKRVQGVLDRHLKATGTDYLVGDKYTYADLAFIPWFLVVPAPMCMGPDYEATIEKELPHYWAWWQRILNRPVTQKVKKIREDSMSKGH